MMTTQRAMALLSLFFLSALLMGCETQQGYAVCELDKEVTSKNICNGQGAGGTGNSTSCVVRSHPHCVEAICLSYFSRQSICSRVCKTDEDCLIDGIQGFCWEFAGSTSTQAAEKYCVPPDSYYDKLVKE